MDAVMYAPASYGPRTNCAVSHLEITSFNAPIFSPFYNVIWLRVDCRNRSNRSGSAAFLHPALAVPDCSALCFEGLATSNAEIISVACRNICIVRCEHPIIHHLLDFLSSPPSSAPGDCSRWTPPFEVRCFSFRFQQFVNLFKCCNLHFRLLFPGSRPALAFAVFILLRCLCTQTSSFRSR